MHCSKVYDGTHISQAASVGLSACLCTEALQLTTLPSVRSTVVCILAAPFLQQKSYNVAEVSLFLLLCKMFCSPAFVPVFYFSVCLLVLLGLVGTFRVC